jgi:hypothetical protein
MHCIIIDHNTSRITLANNNTTTDKPAPPNLHQSNHGGNGKDQGTSISQANDGMNSHLISSTIIYRHASSSSTNQQEIEAEMARTQKNKATNYHLGTLKAKLAKLRNDLLIEQGGGGGGGREFDIVMLF